MPDVFVAPHEEQEQPLTPSRFRTAPDDTTVPQAAPAIVLSEPTQLPYQPTPSVQPPPVEHQQAPTTSSTSITPTEKLVHEQHTNSIPLFTSFWQNPQGVYFDTQEANEHILLFLRRHFTTNLSWILSVILFSLLPVLLVYVLQFVTLPSFIPAIYIRASGIFYYLSLATYAFIQFINWYYNISLITPKRVLDIEFKDLVYKKISATKISLVQDINYEQTGTIRSIFDYGDVLIQTAGTLENFYINSVPKPEVVVRIVESIIGREPSNDEEEREEHSVIGSHIEEAHHAH